MELENFDASLLGVVVVEDVRYEDHDHDDHREVLVQVDRGDDDVVQIGNLWGWMTYLLLLVQFKDAVVELVVLVDLPHRLLALGIGEI